MTSGDDEKDLVLSRKAMWAIVAIGVVTAALPHFFFAPPLQLHMDGDMRGFFGISVWMPAILGGVAFFGGVESDARLSEPASTANLAAMTILAPIIYAVVLAFQYEERFSQMAGMRPWDELYYILPLYSVLGMLTPLFWQGLVQGELLDDRHRAVRVLTVVAGAVAVWAPFIVQTGLSEASYLLTAAIGAGLLAWLFEMGATVRTIALSGGLMGALFVWFQQAVFL